MEGINAKISEKKECLISMDIEVKKEIVDKKREEVFVKIRNTAQVSGFRTGKAPMDLVKKKFSATAESELLQELVPFVIRESVTAQNIIPLVYPDIKDLKFGDNGELNLKIGIEIAPEFEVKGYKGIKIKKEKVDIKEDDVTKYIDNLRERSANMAEDEIGVVKNNSFVVIDYSGTLDGEAFEGGQEKDRLLPIENSGFIPGFSEAIVGMKKGDEKDVSLVFPKDYHKKELASKDVIFKITVKEVKKKILPELDEEFAKLCGVGSVGELRDSVRKNLTNMKEDQIKQDTEKQLMTKLIKKNAIEVPNSVVEKQIDYMIERSKQYLRMQNMDPKMMGADDEALRKNYLEDAKKQVQFSYILNAIAEKEKIEVTDQDLKEEESKLIEQNKDEKKIKEYFKKEQRFYKIQPKRKENIRLSTKFII